jgi:hypothetical protein
MRHRNAGGGSRLPKCRTIGMRITVLVFLSIGIIRAQIHDWAHFVRIGGYVGSPPPISIAYLRDPRLAGAPWRGRNRKGNGDWEADIAAGASHTIFEPVARTTLKCWLGWVNTPLQSGSWFQAHIQSEYGAGTVLMHTSFRPQPSCRQPFRSAARRP